MFKLTRMGHAVSVALCGLCSATAVVPALAQDIQRIEITGSNIKRIDAETSSPVQVIGREEIKRSGAGSIKELIDQLPSATGSLTDLGGSNSFASGASSATLRNLGKTSTLILLNFRRVSPYALADFNETFTNLDSLPLDAVDRVEILKSGASAIYGSDAVAGVINIITRKDYQGLQFSAGYEESLKSRKFGQGTFSITGGFGDLNKDRYNVLANVEFFKRDNVIWRDVLQYMHPRTFRRIPQTFAAQASTFSYPGNVANAAGVLGPVAGCPSELVISNLCRYDRYTRFEAQPSAERTNLLLSGRLLLSKDLEGFAEVLYSKTKTTYISPFQPYGAAIGTTTWGNPQTNSGQTFIPRGLPAGHPLNPTAVDDVELRYRFVDAPSEASPTSDNYRVQAGLKGTLGAYDWESAVGFMGSKVTDLSRGRFSNSAFIDLIGDYNLDPLPADFFNRPNGYRLGQANSAAVVDRLFPEYGSVGKTTQVALDGKITGDITQLAAGPLGLAAGFDLRREKFTIDPTANLRAGDIVGFGLSSTEGSRTFFATFGELNVPVTKQLEAQLAVRVDKYPNFSANLAPKIALRYEPVPGLLFRSGIETGFRAPNLTETAPSVKFAFNNGVLDPLRCSQAESLATALLAQAEALPANDPNRTVLEARADIVQGNECSAGVAAIAGNNPNLKPELSKSFSLGMVFEPARGLSISADYWDIRRKDEIDIKSATELLAAEGTTLPPGSSIQRDPLTRDPTFTAAEQALYGVTAGPLASITRSFENVSRTKTSGIDIGLSSNTNLPIGKLDMSFVGTYLIKYREFSGTRGDFGDNLAGRYTYPRFSGSLSAALTTGDFTNGLKIRHSAGTSLQGDFFDVGWDPAACAARRPIAISADECRVRTEEYLDYFFSYRGFKNLTLGLYIRNLLNKLPPADLRDLADNGSNTIPQNAGDAQGRTLKLSVEYKFL
jgi:iron complex outermembrane recepter protein